MVVEDINRCQACFLVGRACDSACVPMASREYLVPYLWARVVLTFCASGTH